LHVAAGRPICSMCAGGITDAGALAASALKAS